MDQALAILPQEIQSWEWGFGIETCAEAVALAKGFWLGQVEGGESFTPTSILPPYLRVSAAVPSQPHLSQLPVTWLSCPQVTVHGQLEDMALDIEAPEAVTEPLSGMEQPPPHPGHMPKEEAGGVKPPDLWMS
ncbi:hypothetical protein Y1Q_0003152 [Alligator mississippiensis]|nr:hypothetical protein Y1Q_0003152 [Alligator mississippiensis]